MKKFLVMLLALVLPLGPFTRAYAEPFSDVLIHQTAGDISVLRHVVLPDGGVLLDGCIQSDFDRITPGNWNHLFLMRVDGQGNMVWLTVYTSTLGAIPYDQSVLRVEKDSVTVLHFADLIGNDHCKMTEMRFDLTTGKQLDGPDTISISAQEVPTVTHTGDFRVETYYRDSTGDTVRTLITYIPTGRTAEYQFCGLQHTAAFGDKLVCFFVDTQDRAYFDVYGTDCLPVMESVSFAPGTTPYVNHTAATKDKLSIFAWTNRENPDRRTYTLFQMDRDMNISPALTSFTLAEGHSLGKVAPCGDGFLLTDLMPWEWGVITTCDLLHLDMDGSLRPLLSGLPEQRSTVTLLPCMEDGQARVILRDEAGSGLRQMVYTD